MVYQLLILYLGESERVERGSCKLLKTFLH